MRRLAGRLAAVVLLAAAVLGAGLLVAGADERRWAEQCAALGGRVEPGPRTAANPLLVQGSGPVDHCRGPRGQDLLPERG